MRQLSVLGCFAALAISLPAQTLNTPVAFRLVSPNGPGGISVTTAGGWVPERFVLYDKNQRAVFLLKNEKLGLNLSYTLLNDETYDFSKESCRNDVLGGILGSVLSKATVRNKMSSSRILPTGQTLDIGSYLVEKNEGISLNQQNVFGFVSHNHTCAEIHLSRTSFKPGEEQLFDPFLNSFAFDPAYLPTTADYALMARLLPPGMASAYPGGTPQRTDMQLALDPSDQVTQSLTFQLPSHAGYLHMDAPNFVITEVSAKPNGQEFGIRAKDRQISGTEALGFLFLASPAQPSAVACRDWMLASEEKEGVKDRKILARYEGRSDSGVPLAIVDYEQPKAPANARFVRRFFVDHADLCADIALTTARLPVTGTANALMQSLVFTPDRQPDFYAKFRYATVLFDHHQVAAAAPVYESALTLVDQSDDPRKWRRITTDQASVAYGISGDLKHSREVNEAAIAKDPDYPLFYYNLACADAEAGDATATRKHLQQAFDRRANSLPGANLPDPAKDDSLLKLKKDHAFWSFLQTLPKS